MLGVQRTGVLVKGWVSRIKPTLMQSRVMSNDIFFGMGGTSREHQLAALTTASPRSPLKTSSECRRTSCSVAGLPKRAAPTGSCSRKRTRLNSIETRRQGQPRKPISRGPEAAEARPQRPLSGVLRPSALSRAAGGRCTAEICTAEEHRGPLLTDFSYAATVPTQSDRGVNPPLERVEMAHPNPSLDVVELATTGYCTTTPNQSPSLFRD